MAIYDVTKYGVYNDGETNNTKAIKAVIEIAEKKRRRYNIFPVWKVYFRIN